MVIDVAAEVVSNTRLSPDYNVIGLSGAGDRGRAQPGQFVMVRPRTGLDPLLRRPFSIFEILRDERGRAVRPEPAEQAVGAGTSQLYRAGPGDRVGVPRPARPAVRARRLRPQEAWMVAGGVGLAPFATLAEALAERRTPMTLFYGGRSAARSVLRGASSSELGARLVLTTEDGSRG